MQVMPILRKVNFLVQLLDSNKCKFVVIKFNRIKNIFLAAIQSPITAPSLIFQSDNIAQHFRVFSFYNIMFDEGEDFYMLDKFLLILRVCIHKCLHTQIALIKHYIANTHLKFEHVISIRRTFTHVFTNLNF